MKIALLGYGKMGHEIESIALERGHQVILRFDSEADWLNCGNELCNADVAIDFSTPESAISNIHKCFTGGIPIVCGTTGWHNQLEEIRNECLIKGATLFFASNFSLGVNLFFELNRCLAKMMNTYKDYTVSIDETHHIHKLDKPSGTAITLATDIIGQLDRVNSWSNEENMTQSELTINSFRQGEVAGIHAVRYNSESDTIEIRHIAKNRRGFAAGAVLAAEFIVGKRGFFGMGDLLKMY
jgi:4-hydroxy-tetrahydrodipicolinate reductase